MAQAVQSGTPIVPSTRTRIASLLCSSAAVVGCSKSSSDVPASVTMNCGASDEAWLAMQDLVDAGAAQIDDAHAATLSAPASGAQLSAAAPTTFQWTLPPSPAGVLPHGIDSGTFVWLHITGTKLTAPFDVISVEPCLSYPPSAADWARIAGAPGKLTVSIYTAKESLNVVTEGPFQPTTNAFAFTAIP